MIAPEFSIEFNDQRLIARFDTLTADIKTKLRGRINTLTRRLHGMVQAAEPRRTGRLHELTRAVITEGENYIRGRVVIRGDRRGAHNVAAAALEYGAHRVSRVREHTARRTRVFGRPVGSITVRIRAHRRRPNIAARRFLRGPAAAIRPLALAEIKAALGDAIEANQQRS